MNKFWNWIKVALAIVFSVLVYVFFTRRDNSELMKKIKEVKTEAKKQEKIVEKVEKRIENRKEKTEIRKKKAKDLSKRLKKHFNIFLIVCLIVSFNVVGIASSNIEDLIIPDSYQELVEAYKDMANIAIGYQRLYNEAEQALAKSEADNQILLEVIKNLQSLMKIQQDIINDLLQKNRISIFTGINYVPLNPSYSGILAGITLEF